MTERSSPGSDPREIVARAIHDALGGNGWAYSYYGGDEWNDKRSHLLDAADAVMSLRVPTQAAPQGSGMHAGGGDGTFDCVDRSDEGKTAALPQSASVLERLLTSAKILQQNAEGCAANHYGEDCQLFGMPGWLADTKKDIEAAQEALAGRTQPQEVIPTDEDHPDCATARERELYDALMLLAGACMNHTYKSYKTWMQGGIKVDPVVTKALRLYEHSLSRPQRSDPPSKPRADMRQIFSDGDNTHRFPKGK